MAMKMVMIYIKAMVMVIMIMLMMVMMLLKFTAVVWSCRYEATWSSWLPIKSHFGANLQTFNISNFSNWNSVKCQNRNGRHVFEVEIMPKLLFKKKETTLSVKTSAWAIDQVIRTNNQSLEITKSEKC